MAFVLIISLLSAKIVMKRSEITFLMPAKRPFHGLTGMQMPNPYSSLVLLLGIIINIALYMVKLPI